MSKGLGYMDYLTIKEAGEKWGLGTRIITLYCVENRISGAIKRGNLWLIPVDAKRPVDKRRKGQVLHKSKRSIADDLSYVLTATNQPMPSDNPDAILSMLEEERLRRIRQADLAYLRGDFAQTIAYYRKIGHDDAVRIRACPLAIASAISLGDYHAYTEIETSLKRVIQTNTDKQVKAVADCTLATISISVIAPHTAPEWLKNGDLQTLPSMVRLDVIYLRAKYFQRTGQFEIMLAVSQTALSLCISEQGIKWHDIYLHLMCAIACHSLERREEARHWLVLAMHRALPHGFITPFAENVTALGGLMEKCLEEEYPDYYHTVIDQWKNTWKNRVTFHNQFTKNNITLILTLQEYHVAVLVAKRVPYTKIAKQYHISVGRLKNIMQNVYAKLFITNRNQLAKYIL